MSYRYYITPEEYEVAAANGISRKVVNGRVRERGWKVAEAITTPLRSQTPIDPRLVAAAKANGISYKTLHQRLRYYGMSPEEASTRPLMTVSEVSEIRLKNRRSLVDYRNVAVSNGISIHTYLKRLYLGWPPDRAATTPVDTRKSPNKYIKRA